jgi:hypothetical protein
MVLATFGHEEGDLFMKRIYALATVMSVFTANVLADEKEAVVGILSKVNGNSRCSLNPSFSEVRKSAERCIANAEVPMNNPVVWVVITDNQKAEACVADVFDNYAKANPNTVSFDQLSEILNIWNFEYKGQKTLDMMKNFYELTHDRLTANETVTLAKTMKIYREYPGRGLNSPEEGSFTNKAISNYFVQHQFDPKFSLGDAEFLMRNYDSRADQGQRSEIMKIWKARWSARKTLLKAGKWR